MLGGSVYAFATMLATFLTGIAIGAAIASWLARTRERAGISFAAAQLGIAALSVAAFASADQLAALAQPASAGGQVTRGALLAALALLPGAISVGATFPLAVRILARNETEAASASARVFAWNTVGAIAGALLSGYVLLPALHFAGTAVAAAVMSLILAAIAAIAATPGRARFSRRLLAGTAVLGLLFIAWRPPSTPWQVLRFSQLAPAGNDPERAPVAHFAVGRSATVMLTEHPNYWSLTTNGLPESSISRPWGLPMRHIVARWLSLLPLAARPESKSMLVVGLGAGITIDNLPATLEEVHVVELEPEVIRANRLLADKRASDPLADPRLQLHVNDARGALRLTSKRFDAIVSQPSHPWTSGASNLYTREFLRLVNERLSPEGVFVQWMGLTFVDEQLLRSMVATALDVFPHVEVYRPIPNAVLLMASPAPLDLATNASRALASAPEQWATMGALHTEDLLAARSLDVEGARTFAHEAPLSSDRRNLFRSRGPTVLANPLRAMGADQLFARHEPLEPAGVEEGLYLVRRLIRQNEPDRARRLAATLPDEEARQVGYALADRAMGRVGMAKRELQQALHINRTSKHARNALLELSRPAFLRREPTPAPLRELSGAELALADGWRLEGAGRLAGDQTPRSTARRDRQSQPTFRVGGTTARVLASSQW